MEGVTGFEGISLARSHSSPVAGSYLIHDALGARIGRTCSEARLLVCTFAAIVSVDAIVFRTNIKQMRLRVVDPAKPRVMNLSGAQYIPIRKFTVKVEP